MRPESSEEIFFVRTCAGFPSRLPKRLPFQRRSSPNCPASHRLVPYHPIENIEAHNRAMLRRNLPVSLERRPSLVVPALSQSKGAESKEGVRPLQAFRKPFFLVFGRLAALIRNDARGGRLAGFFTRPPPRLFACGEPLPCLLLGHRTPPLRTQSRAICRLRLPRNIMPWSSLRQNQGRTFRKLEKYSGPTPKVGFC